MVKAPAPISDAAAKKAKILALRTMEHLNGAGMFGIEMFLTNDNQVLINELAPRVHNSGHYTIEACITNQFEQHIRAITGLPLGSTDMIVPFAVMINILGERKGRMKLEGLHRALQLKGVSVHVYNKADTKLERKMGHITVISDTIDQGLQVAQEARSYISI